MPFTDKGFLNASFEYGEADATSRSVQRDDAAALIAGGNTDVANPAQIWGSPEVADDLKTFFNMGLEISDSAEAYAFGNYATKEVTGGFFFRNPDTRPAVYQSEPGVRLVGDITDDLSGNCPTNLATDDAAGLASVIADPNCFVFNEILPGGFTPNFGAETEDFSLVVGTRGTLDNGLGYDVSGSLGYNDADYFINNTVNASLGPATPLNFDPGAYTQFEKNFNIDVTYPIAVAAFASDLNIAAGFEWREEEFEVTIGDQASWEVGPLADQGFSAASNGFPGFGPLAAGNWSRDNIAFYLDAEADVTERWLVGAAIRWEDFSDFGSTTNGKLSTLFEITDNISLRGSWSTGFRAPTPGQSNAFNVTTELNVETGELQNNGTIPSISPVAELRGGLPLEPEESTNMSAGVILEFGNLAVTIDYFDIEVEDRLAISQEFALTDAEKEALIAEGVAGADSLAAFRFFTNGLETETTGWDVVATYSLESGMGLTDFNLAWNRTETEVANSNSGIIDAGRVQELEEGLPETRWNVGATHTMGDWRMMARYSYFDDWFDSFEGTTFDGYGLVDAEVAYNMASGLSLIVGANNLLDEVPDEVPNPGAFGLRYSQYAPGGFNGRLAYLRVTYDF